MKLASKKELKEDIEGLKWSGYACLLLSVVVLVIGFLTTNFWVLFISFFAFFTLFVTGWVALIGRLIKLVRYELRVKKLR